MKNIKMPIQHDLLRRPRIDKLFEEGLKQPFLAVVTGVGYGKTLSARSYLSGTQKRIVWLHLVSLDNYARRFWENFLTSLRASMPQLADDLLGMDFPDTVQKYDTFLRVLAKDLYQGEQVVMVVDDYHCITNDDIRNFFRHLIEAELENFCLVVMSTAKSPVYIYPLLKNSDRFMSITSEDLAFTEKEADNLFGSSGHALSPESLKQIMDDTEGWPLALYLINSKYKKEGSINIDRTDGHLSVVDAIFESEFFREYDDDFQKLLIALSLCQSFSDEMIREIGGCDYNKARRNLHNHMFISYDYSKRIYIFQKMYRSFLSTKQSCLEEEFKKRIYCIGGDYFYAQGQYFEAVTYYHKCRDYDGMIRAIMKIPNVRHRIGASNFLLECLEDIPEDYARYDSVLFCRGYLHMNNNEMEKSRRLFETLKERLENNGDTPENRQLLGETYISLGDISLLYHSYDFCEYFKKAAALLPGGSKSRDPELMYVANNSVFFLPANTAGSLARTIDLIFEAAPYAEALSNGCAYGFELLFAAEAAYHTCDLERSKEYCYQAIYKAHESAQHDIICNAHYFLMRIAVAGGDYKQAKKNLDKIADHIERNKLIYLHELRDFAENWFYIKMKDIKKVKNWLFDIDGNPESVTSGIGRNRIVRAFYLMARNKYLEAAALLTQMRCVSIWKGRWSVTLSRHILLAKCHYKLKDPNRALAAFIEAYEMSNENFIIMPFVEMGSAIFEIIDFAEETGKYSFERTWINRVYQAAAQYEKNYASAISKYQRGDTARNAAKITFTERELRILNYLAEGLTRGKIADKLKISVNGIKWHITNIYNKLGAINRADAVRIAMNKGYLKQQQEQNHGLRPDPLGARSPDPES